MPLLLEIHDKNRDLLEKKALGSFFYGPAGQQGPEVRASTSPLPRKIQVASSNPSVVPDLTPSSREEFRISRCAEHRATSRNDIRRVRTESYIEISEESDRSSCTISTAPMTRTTIGKISAHSRETIQPPQLSKLQTMSSLVIDATLGKSISAARVEGEDQGRQELLDMKELQAGARAIAQHQQAVVQQSCRQVLRERARLAKARLAIAQTQKRHLQRQGEQHQEQQEQQGVIPAATSHSYSIGDVSTSEDGSNSNGISDDNQYLREYSLHKREWEWLAMSNSDITSYSSGPSTQPPSADPYTFPFPDLADRTLVPNTSGRHMKSIPRPERKMYLKYTISEDMTAARETLMTQLCALKDRDRQWRKKSVGNGVPIEEHGSQLKGDDSHNINGGIIFYNEDAFEPDESVQLYQKVDRYNKPRQEAAVNSSSPPGLKPTAEFGMPLGITGPLVAPSKQPGDWRPHGRSDSTIFFDKDLRKAPYGKIKKEALTHVQTPDQPGPNTQRLTVPGTVYTVSKWSDLGPEAVHARDLSPWSSHEYISATPVDFQKMKKWNDRLAGINEDKPVASTVNLKRTRRDSPSLPPYQPSPTHKSRKKQRASQGDAVLLAHIYPNRPDIAIDGGRLVLNASPALPRRGRPSREDV
jgi:hypothetical protein